MAYDATLGYPVWRMGDMPAGKYCAQADLFPYSVYHRGDGFNLTLPLSCVSDAGGDGCLSRCVHCARARRSARTHPRRDPRRTPPVDCHARSQILSFFSPFRAT